MTNLVMIPAFGCDERLYADIAPLLPSNVLSSTVIADGADFATCVEQVLAQALAAGPVEDMPVRALLRSSTPMTLYWCP